MATGGFTELSLCRNSCLLLKYKDKLLTTNIAKRDNPG